jgi:sulfide dehydrogenase cytochrome subunit
MQKKKRTLVLACGLLAGAMLLSSPASAEPTAEILSDTCAGCHGFDGNSAGPAMPNIAGQPAEYTKDIMMGFQSGERSATIMDRIAKGYTEQQIGTIANFYAKKTWKNAVSNPNSKMATTINADLVKKGATLTKKCAKCHENNGHSIEEGMPRLAGQWVDYLKIKLHDYNNPELKNPQPKKMAKQIKKLAPADLDAIAHFYASQQ